MPTLRTAILAATDKPATYPEIEKAVGRRAGFSLGITLGKMILENKLHYSEPKKYRSKWPVYSANPIPKKYKHPLRPGCIDTDLEIL